MLESIIGPTNFDHNSNLKVGREVPGSRVEIGFDMIPGFPLPTVSGHAGKLICGTMIMRDGKKINVVLLSGRGHFYEGNDAKRSTFPVRVLGAMGLNSLISKWLLVTNQYPTLRDN